MLSDAGISRERLESFDRPIVCEPEWFPNKKDALIREFGNYLGILKAVHSGGWAVGCSWGCRAAGLQGCRQGLRVCALVASMHVCAELSRLASRVTRLTCM